jgi:hypothetical protein
VTAGALGVVATAAGVLAALVVPAVLVVVLAVRVEGDPAGAGGASGEHALRVRASAAHAAAVRHIRPAWQKPPKAETTRSSDTVLGPLGLGY